MLRVRATRVCHDCRPRALGQIERERRRWRHAALHPHYRYCHGYRQTVVEGPLNSTGRIQSACMRACVRTPAGTTLEYDEAACTAQSKAKQSRTKQDEAAHHTLLSNRGADPLCCRSCRFAAQRTTWSSGRATTMATMTTSHQQGCCCTGTPLARGQARERESPAWWWRWRRRPSHAILCWLRRRKAMRHGAPSTGFQSMSCHVMSYWDGGGVGRRDDEKACCG
jgi:hypothetical protein